MPWEIEFLNWLQTIHNPILDRFMVGITYLGSGGILWIVIALALLFSKRYLRWQKCLSHLLANCAGSFIDWMSCHWESNVKTVGCSSKAV